MTAPRILTTTVGSYPVPDWLAALPSEQALVDATRVVFDLQRQAGIDLPTDGELYRFDVNHPDTNGMIDYFVHRLGGVSARGRTARDGGVPREVRDALPQQAGRRRGRADRRGHAEPARGLRARRRGRRRTVQVHADQPVHARAHAARRALPRFQRAHPGDRRRARGAGARPRRAPACRWTRRTSPAIRRTRPLAAEAINRVLDAVRGTKAVHFCFGNYGGQTIQDGTWDALIGFLNSLRADHLVLELAHRPASDLEALRDLRPDDRHRRRRGRHQGQPRRDARRDRRGARACRAGAWPRPGAVRAPGLRVLDAEALGRRPQDRGAGQGARSVSRTLLEMTRA